LQSLLEILERVPRLLASPEERALHERAWERAVVHLLDHAGNESKLAGEPRLKALFERVFERRGGGHAGVGRLPARAGSQTQRHREKTSSQQASHGTASSKISPKSDARRTPVREMRAGF